MRILHTADWHLGCARDKMDRLEEQQAVVREIVAIARAESVFEIPVVGPLLTSRGPGPSAELETAEK